MKKLMVVLFASVFAISCTKKSSKTDYGLELSETLRVHIASEPPTLDWNKATDTTSSRVIDNLMDGLTAYNYDDPELSLVPALAEKWTASKDAKTWTFNLRKDVVWSDGVPFVAQHVIDGWTRLLNPETASEYAYFLYSVKNGEKFSKGEVKDASQLGFKAIDDHTIEVTLESTMSFFPYLLTHASTFPIRLDVIERHGDKWTEAGNLIGLGPYSLKVWEHDKALVIERNDKYYDEPAILKNVIYYMISELSTALNLFDAGKLDSMDELPKSEIAALSHRPEHKKHSFLILQYYGFNVDTPPFNNANLRKAIAHAIDKQEVINAMGAGDIPMKTWVPVGMFGYEPDMGLSFDVEKAKDFLKKAGYEDATKVPRLTLAFNTNENHQKVAENIQAQLKRNLGINLDLKNEEWKVYLSNLKANAHPMFRMGWVADYPDPDNFLNLMISSSQNNRSRWKNADYDRFIAQAAAELNKEKRRELYKKAQKILVEDEVPVIPLFTAVHHLLVSERVENYPMNVLNNLPYNKVRLKK